MSLWKPSGRMDCVNLEKGFFLIRFSLKEEYERVLKDGPWFVGGHDLSIRNWEPNFKPSTTSVTSVVVWIRLPELPIKYYKPSVLRELSQAIGLVLRVDTYTATESRGRFVRICVQINFKKPLIKLIRTGGVEQPVLYKVINSLRFSYGRIGHKVECCPYMTKTPVNKDDRKEEDKVDGHVIVALECNEPSGDAYGPWVLVSRKKKRGHGALGVKEYRQKKIVERNTFLLGSDSNHQLTKLIVFLAGSSMISGFEPLPDMGTSTLGVVGQGETIAGVGSEEINVYSAKTTLRDISNQKPPPNRDMLELVAMVALNVSTAELKHIDPKLRPPKKGSEVISSPCSVQEEDNMVQDEIHKDPAQGNHKVDLDGMQIEGGGGIWLLWDSTQVEIFKLSSMEQKIHALVKDLSSNASWLLSAIYASPRYAERRLLWDNLSKVAELHALPWITAGDFNKVLLGEAKFGGRPVCISRALKFQDCLNNCGMIDLGFFWSLIHLDQSATTSSSCVRKN
ncbi:uncharacterized protein LOC142625512 [Castanea sativa]|uniref:uncharacterized protein LOC142625512 n=1 Tax=Castanea sativa TaxID=21020 RepID=UPI003F650FCE